MPRLVESLYAGAGALVVGLALQAVAVYLRDDGPAWDGVSFRGNGALVVLPVALVLVLVGVVACARRRAWLGMLLVPVGVFLGMFVVAGSF